MKKSEIIQRLLKEDQITVEEAMTLMSQDLVSIPTIPYNPPYTDWAYNPKIPPNITYDLNGSNTKNYKQDQTNNQKQILKD